MPPNETTGEGHDGCRAKVQALTPLGAESRRLFLCRGLTGHLGGCSASCCSREGKLERMFSKLLCRETVTMHYECQHTERSRNIQWVLVVPSRQKYPGDLEVHEAQRSQKHLGVQSLTLLVVLQRGKEKVNLHFRGNQFDQLVRVLHEIPGCQ
ncbi:hypothetical protein EYF80_006642 [Liparis tanakae]|uniref:Uncharacterized protein n=1 Tax=Liparis tanakae TaxID=230148 RepID=A0A4Z2IYH6_9TELE|nr:hypothetical protein EYF80_006642 [Liparis tanakae]